MSQFSWVFVLLTVTNFLYVAKARWELAWSDEFDGDSLNESNWAYESGPWKTNSELEYYTDHRKENVRVEEGNLIIEAIPENFGGREFTSGRLKSVYSFAYGKFEARARLPNGKNLWPAIWAFPCESFYGDHPRSGEIDIMEMDCSNSRKYSGSIHAGADPEHIYSRTTGLHSFPVDFSIGFHRFGIEWTKKEFRFVCDGEKFFSISIDKLLYPGKGPVVYNKPGQPFDQTFFWVLNLAIGGMFFGPPPYITQAEAKDSWKRNIMQIDWIRNYRWVND